MRGRALEGVLAPDRHGPAVEPFKRQEARPRTRALRSGRGETQSNRTPLARGADRDKVDGSDLGPSHSPMFVAT